MYDIGENMYELLFCSQECVTKPSTGTFPPKPAADAACLTVSDQFADSGSLADWLETFRTKEE